MGQQQLILVILVTVLIGIATVVAFNTFSSAADSAREDAIRQDLASIAASAQGYYMRPSILGGGGNKFTDIDFTKIAFNGKIDASDSKIAENENATYTMSGIDEAEFIVTAIASSGTFQLIGTVTPNNMAIPARITID